jgi:hypothetical protein
MSNKNLASNYRELAGDLMGQTRTKRKGLSRLFSKPVLSIS